MSVPISEEHVFEIVQVVSGSSVFRTKRPAMDDEALPSPSASDASPSAAPTKPLFRYIKLCLIVCHSSFMFYFICRSVVDFAINRNLYIFLSFLICASVFAVGLYGIWQSNFGTLCFSAIICLVLAVVATICYIDEFRFRFHHLLLPLIALYAIFLLTALYVCVVSETKSSLQRHREESRRNSRNIRPVLLDQRMRPPLACVTRRSPSDRYRQNVPVWLGFGRYQRRPNYLPTPGNLHPIAGYQIPILSINADGNTFANSPSFSRYGPPDYEEAIIKNSDLPPKYEDVVTGVGGKITV